MDQWRTQVTSREKPRRRRSSILATGCSFILTTAAGLALLGGAVVGLGPAGRFQRATEEIEGVVVAEALRPDRMGLARYLNPVLDALEFEPIESFPPYLDSYHLVVFTDDVTLPVEFLSWSLGDEVALDELAEKIEPGDVVSILARPDIGHYDGVLIEKLSSGEAPRPFSPDYVDLQITPIPKALEQGFIELHTRLGTYKIPDHFLRVAASLDENLYPVTWDKDTLAQSLYEQLGERDVSYCPVGAAENIFSLGHADLIRLYLMVEYLEKPENRSELAMWMEEDRVDRTAEHGGWIMLKGNEIMLDRVPSTRDNCGDLCDYHYTTNLNRYYLPDTLGMFHFHAQWPHTEDACPSGVPKYESGDMDNVREFKAPGYVFVTLSGERFNASFYTKTADGSDEVVINLGPYDFGE